MRSVSLLSALAVAFLAFPAVAQDGGGARNATVPPDKPARLAVVTGLKRDCSVGEAGSIRIVTPPKNGSLVVRSDKLKTPANFRCPNVETPVQVLLYQAKKGFSGADEVTYETRSPDGQTRTVTMRLTVSGKPGSASGGLLDL